MSATDLQTLHSSCWRSYWRSDLAYVLFWWAPHYMQTFSQIISTSAQQSMWATPLCCSARWDSRGTKFLAHIALQINKCRLWPELLMHCHSDSIRLGNTSLRTNAQFASAHSREAFNCVSIALVSSLSIPAGGGFHISCAWCLSGGASSLDWLQTQRELPRRASLLRSAHGHDDSSERASRQSHLPSICVTNAWSTGGPDEGICLRIKACVKLAPALTCILAWSPSFVKYWKTFSSWLEGVCSCRQWEILQNKVVKSLPASIISIPRQVLSLPQSAHQRCLFALSCNLRFCYALLSLSAPLGHLA